LLPLQIVEEKIYKIKLGDCSTREDFIDDCKPFVFKVACTFSRRLLEWGRDDELSIALIAFNEAIDRFRQDSGVPFLAFARIVMVSRLTDYQRHEKKNALAMVPLPGSGDGPNDIELHKAWEVYWKEAAERDREEEILEFEKLIKKYGVSFEELVLCSPRHRDTRQALMLAAHELAKNQHLVDEFHKKKKLPLAELEKNTGVGRKTLERGRKYIIAIALLIIRQEDFLYLFSYLKLPSC